MTELRVEPLVIPGAPLGSDNPLPFFRDAEPNPHVPCHDNMPSEKRDLLGWQTGWRVLPYRMQDTYTRQRRQLTFRSIVLENENLKATFLPEMGGRLISLFYKPLNRELLARNPVFQPANLAIRNAWFSGGIEWNVGQYGHAFYTCSPIFAASIRGLNGEPALRFYDYERCKNLFWQIDFYLPPGSEFLIASTRIINPWDRENSLYWWTNIAVPEAEGTRVLSPTNQAVYIDHTLKGFGYANLPYLPSVNGKDGTYSLNFPFANEFFFQCDQADMPWETALDQKGTGLIEASTRRLKYRKLFCWGSHGGGRHWQEFLSVPGQAYIEIQAGLAPTQRHGISMPPRSAWEWSEVFGYLAADPHKVHGANWETAWQEVDRALKARMPVSRLNGLASQCQSQTDQPPLEILQQGSGWGALEISRRSQDCCAAPVPSSWLFPQSTLSPQQQRWLNLRIHGSLIEQDPAQLPGEWMIQEEWFSLLEKSLEKAENRNWFALLHLGVMRMERFDEAGARAAWEESIRVKPSAWAYRNLAILAKRDGDTQMTFNTYEKAWTLALACDSSEAALALAQEYLQILVSAGEYKKAQDVYTVLPAEVSEFDRIQILHGVFSLALGDLDSVEDVLKREYAVVREGEIALTDLWFGMWEKRYAAQTGKPVDPSLKAEVRRLYPPPAGIDFRMANE